MIANQQSTGHDYHVESVSKHNSPPSMASTPKHTPLLLRVYEQFLELPVPIVLAVMWLAGAALISLCGLALYLLWLLLQALAGG
jgi:hypothetical protein